MEIKRIVIEIPEKDYEALAFLKNMAKLEWKDILYGGAVFWNEKLNFTERMRELKKMLEETLIFEEKTKKGG